MTRRVLVVVRATDVVEVEFRIDGREVVVNEDVVVAELDELASDKTVVDDGRIGLVCAPVAATLELLRLQLATTNARPRIGNRRVIAATLTFTNNHQPSGREHHGVSHVTRRPIGRPNGFGHSRQSSRPPPGRFAIC